MDLQVFIDFLGRFFEKVPFAQPDARRHFPFVKLEEGLAKTINRSGHAMQKGDAEQSDDNQGDKKHACNAHNQAFPRVASSGAFHRLARTGEASSAFL